MHIIAVDAMGGDHAPQSTVQGSVEALRAYGDLRILLVGQEEKLAPLTDSTVVYPGHGPKSTMAWERAHNPYMRYQA